VTAAPVLAGLAGALAVAGVWEALAAAEQGTVARELARRCARVLAPWRAAGRDGREPSPPERRRLAVVGALTLLAGGWLLAGPVLAVPAAAGGPWVVRRALAARRARWRADLAAGAAPAARALADALAGGHAVHGALAAAAGGGVPGAAGGELRAAAAALALGSRTDDVLERLRQRAADPGWDTIVAAVLLQRDAGGDLARLLRSVAAGLEEAARVEADARSATAQARFTAWLVLGLPAGAAALAELAAPGAVTGLLAAPLTGVLVAGAVACQVTALFLIRRLARVESW